MKPSPRFWNLIAKRYARTPVADQAAYERKLEITRGYLEPHHEVLELGCGTGSTALAHAPHVRHVRAVDISPKMLDIARGKAAKAGVANIDFEQGTVEELALPGESVDVVLTLSLLHLVEDRNELIAAVHRLLVPGGVFVSSTGCLGGTMPLLRWILRVGRLVRLLPLVRCFTRDELRASIEGAGFEIEHEWQPTPKAAVFVVATKPAAGGSDRPANGRV